MYVKGRNLQPNYIFPAVKGLMDCRIINPIYICVFTTIFIYSADAIVSNIYIDTLTFCI